MLRRKNAISHRKLVCQAANDNHYAHALAAREEPDCLKRWRSHAPRRRAQKKFGVKTEQI
jgi:hypothetical protein